MHLVRIAVAAPRGRLIYPHEYGPLAALVHKDNNLSTADHADSVAASCGFSSAWKADRSKTGRRARNFVGKLLRSTGVYSYSQIAEALGVSASCVANKAGGLQHFPFYAHHAVAAAKAAVLGGRAVTEDAWKAHRAQQGGVDVAFAMALVVPTYTDMEIAAAMGYARRSSYSTIRLEKASSLDWSSVLADIYIRVGFCIEEANESSRAS